MKRVIVDWTKCDAHGSCMLLLPDHLAADEWGFPMTIGSGELPKEAVADARRAAQLCPALALRVE